jgi:hypothetical protein
MFRLILLLVIIAAVAAYFTKPDAAAHRAAAEATMQAAQNEAASDVNLGDMLELGVASLMQSGVYEDMYLASKYTVRVREQPFIECWGAFTQVRCTMIDEGAEPAAS